MKAAEDSDDSSGSASDNEEATGTSHGDAITDRLRRERLESQGMYFR